MWASSRPHARGRTTRRSARTRYLPEVDNIEVAELEAIQLAVASAPSGSLLVLSDNATAVGRVAEAIRGLPIRGDRRGTEVLHRIAALSAARPIEVSWVRGHDGQPLNQALRMVWPIR